MPNSGKLLSTKGSTAQWMAHATEAPIPNTSQLMFMPIKSAKILKCNDVANFKTILHLQCYGWLDINFANNQRFDFMSRKAIFYICFFVVLIIAFYVGLKKMIPGYGEVRLPVLSYVQPFSFTDQDGKQITEKNVAGKVYVTEYFFTTCKGICPKMNTNMKDIFQAYKRDTGFLILSHTVDPETDSVARIKHYADSLGADSKSWLFLTGSKQNLYNAARVSYLLDDPKNNSGDVSTQFIHTQFFALVDKGGRVRKIYDGLKRDELAEMKTDIDYLLKEKDSSSRFANSLYKSSAN